MRLALRRLVDHNLPNMCPSQTPAVQFCTQKTTLPSYKQDCKWCPLWRGKNVTKAILFQGTRLLWFQERSYQKAPPSANGEGNYVAIRDTKPHPQCTPNQQIMGRHSLTAVRNAILSVYKFSRNSQMTHTIHFCKHSCAEFNPNGPYIKNTSRISFTPLQKSMAVNKSILKELVNAEWYYVELPDIEFRQNLSRNM